MLPEVEHQLEGWSLLWLRLELCRDARSAALDSVVADAVTRLAETCANRSLAEIPQAAAVRRRFKLAGTDPTRYRPSSEALSRRLLRGDPFPRINPAVDLNNVLSVHVMLPCCVMRESVLSPPFVLRRGAVDETVLSLRGPFSLASKPLLADREGPFSTPITDSQRVAVDGSESAVLLAIYAPEGDDVCRSLADQAEELVAASGVAKIVASGWSGAAGSTS